MIVQKISLNIASFQLIGNWFLPTIPTIGTVILIHGQGDHLQSYKELCAVFCNHGIAVCGLDLPGHGLSSGKRGDIPSMKLVQEILSHLQNLCEEKFPEAMRGVVGHSMGGHLALTHLLESQDFYHFCWLSSPLLKPSSLKPPFLISALLKLAPLFPTLSVDTGASLKGCHRIPKGEIKSQSVYSLYHRRISLRWGAALINSESTLLTRCKKFTPQTITLITNGENDKIVPPKFAKELFTQFSWPNLELRILPRALHEPFKDIKKEECFDIISKWISLSIIPTFYLDQKPPS